jgi:hypothetical protein
MKGQEEGDMSSNEKGELDGQKTVLPITYQSNLTLCVMTPMVPDPILHYASRGKCGGPGHVPRDRDGDEGHTSNDMKSMLHHQGSGGTWRGTVSKQARGRAARVRRRADWGRGGNE